MTSPFTMIRRLIKWRRLFLQFELTVKDPEALLIIADRVIVSEDGKGFLKHWIDEFNPYEDNVAEPTMWILFPIPISAGHSPEPTVSRYVPQMRGNP